MGALSQLLANKKTSDWQQEMINRGVPCEKCGHGTVITPPMTDSEEMVRVECPSCGWAEYKFKPTIINFSDISKS